MQGGSTHTVGGLPRTHLVVDIGLTLVTPGRKVNIAEDQRVSRGVMVLEHVGIDVTTAVDLRLGQEWWARISTHLWLVPGPTCHPSTSCCVPHSKTDTPSSPGILHSPDRVGSHPGLLQEWGRLPPNGDTRAVVSQRKTWPAWVKLSKLSTYLPIICSFITCSYLKHK